MPHFPALDGLRGVAVLAVVLYHFAPGVAPGGFLGVDLFFVLSGFLITSILVNEWWTAFAISLPSFWARRARRLLPALFLVLAAVGVYALVLTNHVDAHQIAEDGLSAFTYVANWHFIASGQSYIQQFVHQAPSPLRHMWSLAIEEQFYLVWPLLVVLIGKLVSGHSVRRPGRRRRQFRLLLVVLCLTLGSLSLVRMITLYGYGGDPNRVYYGTDTRAFIILIGAALGALSVGVPVVRNRLRGLLVALGCVAALGLLAAMASLTTSSAWLYEGGYGAIAVGMIVVLAAAAQPGFNPLARVLKARPLVGLGLISYGVYLWHWPVALWLTAQSTGVDGIALFTLRSAVTLAAALASYFLVEQPIRHGRIPRWRLSNPGVVPMVIVTAVAILLLFPTFAFPSVAAAPTTVASATGVADVTAHYGAAPRCDNSAGAVRVNPAHEILVQLVGNSIAQEMRACLTSILRARGAGLEGFSPYGFHLCDILPDVQKQARDRSTRPTAAIFFALVTPDPDCGPHTTIKTVVDRFVKIWKDLGIHIYLIPAVPPATGGTVQNQEVGGVKLTGAAPSDATYYRSLAARDPANITVLDAGTFLRDTTGRYQWRMPCLAQEPGCSSNHTVGVRWLDGLHFCTDPGFASHQNACPSVANQGGERRAAAATASGLLPSLHTVSTASTPSK